MPTEIVHPVPVEQLLSWVQAMATGFLMDPADAPDFVAGRREEWRPELAWGARDGERWVATLRTMRHRLTVPGGEVDADALTNVTVAATHRRRGLLTSMLTSSLADAKQRGEAVSILISAEWPIYGRFGYAPAAQSAHYSLQSGPRGPRLRSRPVGGLRQLESAELGRLAPDMFSRLRAQRPGNIDRNDLWWRRTLGLEGLASGDKTPWTHVVHEGVDGPDGYVNWAPSSAWDETAHHAQLKVKELISTTDEAYTALWGYLLGIDMVDQVHIRYRPVDEPLPWLLDDGRALRETYRGDRLWLRLLDVPLALAARRYAVADHIVLEVTDDAGYASGCFELAAGPDSAACTPTSAAADVRLTQRTLAASYLGGFTISEQLVTGEIEQLRPGAVNRLDAMLATPLKPWCATGF